jgi:ATP-binding cassette, subfamily B (MDR/TAP), member 1
VGGEIFIDGVPIAMLETGWIRNNFTLVQQRSILFNETIFQNLIFGSRTSNAVTKQSLQACIDMANLQNLIDKMPDGLDTTVGVDGNLLSGGQKQRIAIARAMLRDTPILILDECTSALDSENRVAIMKSIRTWREGKTTIIITHDMSQVSNNDFVYVLEQGQVIHSGRKNKLEIMGRLGPSLQLHSNSRLPRATQLPGTSTDTMHDQVSNPMPSMLPHYEQRFSQYRNSGYRWSIASSLPQVPATIHNSYIKRDRMAHAKFKEADNRKLPETSLGSSDEFFGYSENRADGYGKVRSQFELPNSQLPRQPALKTKKLEKKNISNFSAANSQLVSMLKTLSTVFQSLTHQNRIYLAFGLLCAFIHSTTTSVFAYLLSRLLETFYIGDDRSQMAKRWSLAVLGVAVGDTIVSYLMYYLLEYCGQVWTDYLRKEALKRILNQPRSWFDREENNHHILTLCLDGKAEEMRNIVSKFAGLVLVAINVVIIAVIWSFIICWKLTLVGILCGPIVYAITRGFEIVSGRWESCCNAINESIFSTFSEVFSNVRTVRALTLEPYFYAKHIKALKKAKTAGLRRAIYSGFFFGLAGSGIIFVSGRSPMSRALWNPHSLPYQRYFSMLEQYW